VNGFLQAKHHHSAIAINRDVVIVIEEGDALVG
jgi:hypothetical protein